MGLAQDRIGAALVGEDQLSSADWRRAQALAEQSDQNIRLVLDRLGLVAQEAWATAAAAALNVEFVDLEKRDDAPIFHDALSREFQLNHKIAVLDEGDHSLTLAMADPGDEYVVRAVALAVGKDVEPVAAIERVIEARLRGGDGDDASGAVLDHSGDEIEADLDRLKSLASDAPVIRFVDDMLATALNRRASDIHLEPFEGRLQVRYRIDGALEDAASPPVLSGNGAGAGAAVISRIKLLAGLDIAERRLPQDGRVAARVNGAEIDLRVASAPCLHGESLVMRILAREDGAPSFDDLGLDETSIAEIKTALSRGAGMVAVTGPTGSGKTTSLYAALDWLNNGKRKILTTEDPIEYQIDGVVQMPVKNDIGLSFSRNLRAMLRLDPDIVMVGEMRDGETARIAAQAALTGHLVLSTLHTNDAPSAVTRLQDMGVEPYIIASTLRMAVAQRLVRRLCENCKTPLDHDAILPDGVTREGAHFHKAVGCEACNGTGYRGRIGVYEIMTVTDDLATEIARGRDAGALRKAARSGGMRTLREAALERARAGETSLEEALSISGEG